MSMRTVKIRKVLEEELLGVVEVNPNIIVWANQPDWILYSENFLGINSRIGLNTNNLIKIMSISDEETKVKEGKKY